MNSPMGFIRPSPDVVGLPTRVDEAEQRTDHASMDPVTPREFTATLDAMDARWDARFSKFEAVIDSRVKAVEEAVSRSVIASDNSVTATKAEGKSTRATLIVTGISVALAIVFGIAAFNATLLSNMVASFESGRNVATGVVETKQQAEALSKDIQALRDQLNATPRPLPPSPSAPTSSSSSPEQTDIGMARLGNRRK